MSSIIAKVLKEIINLLPSVSYSYPESVELTAPHSLRRETDLYRELMYIQISFSCMLPPPVLTLGLGMN